MRFRQPSKKALLGLGFLVLATVVLATSILATSTAEACTTPVFRYAMLNWPSSPFEVVYFHRGEPSEEDAQTNKFLVDLSEASGARANVRLHIVDAAEPKALERIPKRLTDIWKAQAEDVKSLHVVFTPWGSEFFSGKLDKKTVKAMVDSPARTKIAKLLDEGHATIFVLLAGSKKAGNKAAEKVVKEVIDEVTAEQKKAEEGTEDDAPAAESSAVEEMYEMEEEQEPLTIALVTISRDDPAEKWFVRMLMGMEDDLQEFAEGPILFPVYGRGRALLPFLGKGIHADNLFACIGFLAGPCSCTVKSQSPGVDLLFHWDWDATAEKLAVEEEDAYPNQFGYEEFSPEETQRPSPSTDPDTPAEQESPDEKAPAAEPSESPGTDADASTSESATSSWAEGEVAGSQSTSFSMDETAPQSESADSSASETRATTTADPGASDAAEAEFGALFAAQPPADKVSPFSRDMRHGDAPPAAKPATKEPTSDPAPVATVEEAPAKTGPSDQGGSFATRQAWTVGIGLTVVAAVVLVTGYAMLRRA